MRLPHFDLHQPSTLEEAFSLMEGGALALAGGTDLIPLMKYGLEVPSTLVSLKRVDCLKSIARRDGGVFIGAMTSLAELASSRIISENFAALFQAARSVAAPPIWNVATVGGNICQDSRCLYYNQSRAWRLEKPACLKAGGNVCHAVPKGKKCFSVYSGDLAPALAALGAMARVEKKGGSRSVSILELFSSNGLRPFTLEKEEIVTGVEIALPAKSTNSSYRKMRARPSVDYPLVSAAACVTRDGGGKIEKMRLVLGAVGPSPALVYGAGRLFEGNTLEEADWEAFSELVGKDVRMVDNLSYPGSYRKEMVPIIAARAVRAACGPGGGEENA
ncbi:MAG: FAD binding domain-containing protein [Syntrophobacteraceae bacterium]|nr:FAD binding domain-containing protein [Syntrophobacteraceae bacterium]